MKSALFCVESTPESGQSILATVAIPNSTGILWGISAVWYFIAGAQQHLGNIFSGVLLVPFWTLLEGAVRSVGRVNWFWVYQGRKKEVETRKISTVRGNSFHKG